MLLPTDGYLIACDPCLVPWLPRGWRTHLIPAGWTLLHLARWFEVAVWLTEGPALGFGQPALPQQRPDDVNPPGGRALVRDSYLLARAVCKAETWAEPTISLDVAGCAAELRNLRHQLQQCLVDSRNPITEPDNDDSYDPRRVRVYQEKRYLYSVTLPHEGEAIGHTNDPPDLTQSILYRIPDDTRGDVFVLHQWGVDDPTRSRTAQWLLPVQAAQWLERHKCIVPRSMEHLLRGVSLDTRGPSTRPEQILAELSILGKAPEVEKAPRASAEPLPTSPPHKRSPAKRKKPWSAIGSRNHS